AATSDSAAMPPVPSSCAAMVPSTSPGPPRMRTRPMATVSTTKPAAPARNSVMIERLGEQGLLRGEIGDHGLRDIEAVDQEIAVFVGSGRQGPGQQARQGGKTPTSARP